MNKPISVPEIQEIIRAHPRVAAQGGGSKTALQPCSDGVTLVDVTGLHGLLAYQPEEFTLTAWAGSRVVDIQATLAEHGHYLPFDPVLVERGATLGGTVASGLSGSGRYRYGGLRDFLLGVKFLDGMGNLVRSGGRMVKNAAGFDLSKFMVGSLGHYGILVELTFKVFPASAAYATVQVTYPSLVKALQALTRLGTASLELFALDLEPGEAGCTLLLRLGGLPDTIAGRQERLGEALAAAGATPLEMVASEGASEAELWRSRCEFSWLEPGQTLVKVPLTPRRVPGLDEQLAAQGAQRRYSSGANLAWVGWSGPIEPLHRLLQAQGLSGMAVLGRAEQPLLGVRVGEVFARRVKRALDPEDKFG
jgi:glycolate dehydrogenase FAD-binding subunit